MDEQEFKVLTWIDHGDNTQTFYIYKAGAECLKNEEEIFISEFINMTTEDEASVLKMIYPNINVEQLVKSLECWNREDWSNGSDNYYSWYTERNVPRWV